MAPKPDRPEDELLMPSEVAGMFGVHIRTVGEWARQGKLTLVRTPSGRRRYRAAEVRALRQAAQS
jgi:predicted site-specific integrase-resolvase